MAEEKKIDMNSPEMQSLVESIKSVLKTGIADLSADAVSLEDFTAALKTATIETLKENVPDFELTVKKYLQKHPDAWLVAEDQKTFYIVRPLSRLELKKLSKMVESEEDLVDMVIANCVVYPELTVEQILNMKAGTVKNLLDVIMAISNFTSAMPVVKL